MRVGWIFKTESIVIPAVLDLLGGSAWVRGWLPLMNRIGHAFPPLLAASTLRRMPQKSRSLLRTTLAMACGIGGLGLVYSLGVRSPGYWAPLTFLVIYSLFFAAVGINTNALGVVTAKLVPVDRRGRLLMFANTIGAALAIAAVVLLMPLWVGDGRADFFSVFSFTAVCFLGCAFLTLALREHADPPTPTKGPRFRDHLLLAYHTLRDDRQFRRLALVAVLFGTSLMVFPHYQALAAERLGMSLDFLLLWVVVQNIGTAVFSAAIGPLADRRGNRLALLAALLLSAAAPPAAALISHSPEWSNWLYHPLFLLVGITPVVIKVLQNFTLELSGPEDHPRYLATLSLCMSAPVFASPLLGRLIDLTGFDPAFFLVGGLIALGWILTFGLREPRHAAIRQTVLPAADETV